MVQRPNIWEPLCFALVLGVLLPKRPERPYVSALVTALQIQQRLYPLPCKALPLGGSSRSDLGRGQGQGAQRLQATVPMQAPGTTLATAFAARQGLGT